MSTKNPPTLGGIKPATFRFVEQHLNHCATTVPTKSSTSQYSVESTVTSTVAYVLCFFYHILLIPFISMLTCFHILIITIHAMHVNLFIYQSVNQSVWLGAGNRLRYCCYILVIKYHSIHTLRILSLIMH